MTSKEEKLIELGYKRVVYSYYGKYIKYYKRKAIIIEIHFHRNNEIVGYISDYICIGTQQDIDHLQEAYNILQQDLKELENDSN